MRVSYPKGNPTMNASTPASRREPARLLTVDAVAARLDLSTKTVRRLIASGDLVACRIRRAVRVSEDDLKSFLAQRRA